MFWKLVFFFFANAFLVVFLFLYIRLRMYNYLAGGPVSKQLY